MGKDECKSVVDVEEGEISDSASVEEISEEDFIKQEAKVTNTTNSNSNSNSKPMVWTMGDLYKYSNKYSNSRNYVSGLYNLAWAQAVQNKPLNEVLVMEFKPSENSNLRRSSSSSSMNGREDSKNNSSSSVSSSKEVDNKVIIDVSGDDTDDAKMEDVGDEKEEGELEEGEIDLDSEIEDRVEEGKLIAKDPNVNKADADLKEEWENEVNSIREELKTLTLNDAEKSYDAVCSQLQNSLDRMREVFLQNSVPTKDDIVQLSFAAIQTLNSVFRSMNQNQKEQNREILSSLLGQVTCENTPFFSPEQLKEIEVMIPALGSPAVVSSTADNDVEKKMQVIEKVNQNVSVGENAGHDLTSSKKFALDSRSIESLYPNDPSIFPEPLKLGPGSSKGRGVLLPLLDLHKDHDADSLPSPTRETPPRLLVNRVSAVGDTVFKPDLLQPRAALDTENTVMHPYETDALKAVSTYQQKFGRSSFILKDRLPSPTPSEECDDDGDGGSSGEVSSSSIVGDGNSVYAPNLARPSVSSAHNMDISSVQGLSSAGNAGIPSSGSNPVLRALARSRDPRLRYAKSSAGALDLNQFPLPGMNTEPKMDPLGGIIISKKQKIVEEPVLDGPAPKRQRNGLTDSGLAMDVPTASGSGGWLEDRGTVRPQFINRNQAIEKMGSVTRSLGNEVTCSDATSSTPNITIGGNEQLPITVTNTTASLHSILKDIAVNPAMLMNIIKMEQQKSVDPAKSITQSLSSNSILGAVPLMNVAPPKSSELGQRSAGILQTPQTTSTNMQEELGKVRMKPRDPRRVLHNNTFHKPGSLGSDQCKTNFAPIGSSQGMKGNLYPQKQEDQSDKNSVPSQSITPPDITQQFTKNLKNIADIISVSLEPMSPAISPNFPSQPVQVPLSKVDVKGVVSDSGTLQRTGSSTEEVAVDPSGPKNTWGDVEHLFEGFDDQQKAAIQKERGRRIAEQKKMFATRKLCLVLDLDHTLLNSAKFVEVDSVHDEILRKKEEQDREKPQRQLFRFPHMGMWTKLRPGIWNFLEKASKLFELHLYTMGNKLYATEMAKLLDPKGVLFAGRVISRGDDGDPIDGDERVPKSKDLEGVLGMESSVVIIDDSIKVWPHNKLNLIVVERYIYFPCSRRQFGLPGPSLLEIDHDERSEDGTLASSLAVIEKIHQNFFSHRSLDEADVRNILASEQRKILGGCRIVFSRVFPVGEANPHLHPLWQTAEQFGAVCVNQIDEQVTHVVANSLGTDKVNWALSTGRFVVHPGWVEASALLYRRANELDFAIKP